MLIKAGVSPITNFVTRIRFEAETEECLHEIQKMIEDRIEELK